MMLLRIGGRLRILRADRVALVLLALRDRPDPLDLLAQRDHRVRRATPDQRAQRVPQGRRGPLDRKVRRVSKAIRVRLARQAHKGIRERTAMMAQPVPQALPVRQDQQDQQDHRGRKVIRGPMVRTGLMDLPDQLVQLALPDQRGLREPRARPERQDHQEVAISTPCHRSGPV